MRVQRRKRRHTLARDAIADPGSFFHHSPPFVASVRRTVREGRVRRDRYTYWLDVIERGVDDEHARSDTNIQRLRLPLEIIQTILEFAASPSSSVGPKPWHLCLVSSWSRTVVRPILMRTIVIWDLKQLFDVFCDDNDDARCETQCRGEALQHVQNLWIDPVNVLSVDRDVVLGCFRRRLPALRNLVLASPILFQSMLVAGTLSLPNNGSEGEGMHLYLSMRRDIESWLVDSTLLAARLSTVTHLQLRHPGPSAYLDELLRLFPKLTHLALTYEFHADADADADDDSDDDDGDVFNIFNVLPPNTGEQERRREMTVFALDSDNAVLSFAYAALLQARSQGHRNLYIVNPRNVGEDPRERWLQTAQGEFPSIWERARAETEALERAYGHYYAKGEGKVNRLNAVLTAQTKLGWRGKECRFAFFRRFC